MLEMAKELFDLVRAGKIAAEPRQTFALADAAEAHRALESRKSRNGAGAVISLSVHNRHRGNADEHH